MRSASCLPGAGGEGGGEGSNEARQETERVLARGGEVDERQDDASVKDMAQDRGEDVFSQTGDQKNHIFHLYNFTGHQEYDAKRDVPENQRWEVASDAHGPWVRARCPIHSPHDPGHQHHGGFVESVKEADKLLPLRPQFLQRHAKNHGEQHQPQDVHAVCFCPERHLQHVKRTLLTSSGEGALVNPTPPFWNPDRRDPHSPRGLVASALALRGGVDFGAARVAAPIGGSSQRHDG